MRLGYGASAPRQRHRRHQRLGGGVNGSSNSGPGVFGSSTSGQALYGFGHATNKPAVLGHSTGGNTGVQGHSGAFGSQTAFAGQDGRLRPRGAGQLCNRGRYGESPAGTGTRGSSTSGSGVTGNSSSGYGVAGNSTDLLRHLWRQRLEHRCLRHRLRKHRCSGLQRGIRNTARCTREDRRVRSGQPGGRTRRSVQGPSGADPPATVVSNHAPFEWLQRGPLRRHLGPPLVLQGRHHLEAAGVAGSIGPEPTLEDGDRAILGP